MEFFIYKDLMLHYRWMDSRKPRTFLFINALGTDFRIWDGVVGILQAHGNILLFDKRGHGLSDAGPGTSGLSDFADDAIALLDHLSISQCVIVGLSVGGMIAQLMAIKIPHRIEKLILCDTRHKIGSEQIWNERIDTVKEKGLTAISESIMQRWFPEKFRQKETGIVAGHRIMLERCPPAGYIKTCEAIRDADLTSIARQIKIPTLCVVGSEDKSTTPGEVKDLADLIQGSRFEIIEGSGHLPCTDNPAALCKLIIDFVK